MRYRPGRVFWLVAAGVLLVAGCEQPLPDDGSAASPGQPGVEGTGPEKPAPKAKAKPSVRLPRLPIGPIDDPPPAARSQCVAVKWLAPPEIPDGVTIQVTGVWLDPPTVFRKETFDGCTERLCEKGFVFRAGAYKTSKGQCFVPLIADDEDRYALLKMSGKIQCPAGETRLCAYLTSQVGDKVERGGQEFSIYAPPIEPADTESTQPPDGTGG